MDKSNIILCDTNIIIEYLKGNQNVLDDLTRIGFEKTAISSITYMELIIGAFNKREVSKIKKALANITIYPINENISEKAVELIEKYSKSNGLLIPDALIAATAIHNNLELFTFNEKDFRFISGLQLYDVKD